MGYVGLEWTVVCRKQGKHVSREHMHTYPLSGLPQHSSYLHSSHTVLGVLGNLEMSYCMWQVEHWRCTFYAVTSKGLEHLKVLYNRVLVSEGRRRTPQMYSMQELCSGLQTKWTPIS